MKFSDYQNKMMQNSNIRIRRKNWDELLYVFWSQQQNLFLIHETSADFVWNWNGETTIYEDLTASDWEEVLWN